MEIYDFLIANGAREFEPRQSVQTPTPAPAQSTTVIVQQPSAPAQSNQTPVPSTPTLQTGRYAASGTNISMQLNSPGLVTAYSGALSVATGTYRINGNQLVITFTTGHGDGAGLRGNTYIYNITSGTSFTSSTDSRETWSRRGAM